MHVISPRSLLKPVEIALLCSLNIPEARILTMENFDLRDSTKHCLLAEGRYNHHERFDILRP